MSELNPEKRLRQRIASMPMLPENKPGVWFPLQKGLRHELETCDPGYLLDWATVRSTIMAHGPTPTHEAYLSELEALEDWESRWLPVLQGAPALTSHPQERFHSTMARHAYEALLIEKLAGRPVSEISFVVEFGGGLGDMCRVLRGLGFRGPHLILDLPELCALQEYYLTLSGVPVTWGLWPDEDGGVGLYSEVGALLEDLLSVEDIYCRPGGLLLASHSLEEATPPERNDFLPAMRDRNLYFLNYSSTHQNVGGAEWIADFRNSETGVLWEESPFGYVEGNKLLTGRRKL